MGLLEYSEYIETECALIGKPILKVKALKLDDVKKRKNLKTKVGCKHLSSCDYIKRKNNRLYFIEFSDFHKQLQDLKIYHKDNEAKKTIKKEVRQKLSDTLLIYEQMRKIYKLNEKNEKLQKRAIMALCKSELSDKIIFDFISRDIEKHYCPTHLANIKILTYIEVETTFIRS